MTVRVYERIADVEPDLWDGLGPDPLSNHATLRALERGNVPGVSLRYAVVRDAKGDAVAAAPLAVVDVDGGRLTHGLFRSTVSAVRSVYGRFLHTSILVCGTPLSVGNPPVRMANGKDRPAVFRELAGVVTELSQEEKVPWQVFKEFAAPELESARRSMPNGWIVAPSEPNNVMRIEWPCFEDYLSCLRSHYRYKMRSERRQADAAGVTSAVVPLNGNYDEGLHALYESVLDRAEVQFERLTSAFFEALGQEHGDAAKLLLMRREGRVVGWVVMLIADGVAYDLFHGIDYAENEPNALYFNQLAEVVRVAIDCRVRRLSLGQSTDVAKARFGAVTAPLWIALRHQNAAVRWVLRQGRRVMFPAKEVPARHVFRQ